MVSLTGGRRKGHLKWEGKNGVWGALPQGVQGQSPQKLKTFFVKICYFETVLRCMHDYTNQLSVKWKYQLEAEKW